MHFKIIKGIEDNIRNKQWIINNGINNNINTLQFFMISYFVHKTN